MKPMIGEVLSVTDEFAIRVNPLNTYQHRIEVEVRVYDEHFRPVPAKVLPQRMMLGSQASRSVLVIVGFGGKSEKRVRVCTESVPHPKAKTTIRTRVCGRFLGRRLQ